MHTVESKAPVEAVDVAPGNNAPIKKTGASDWRCVSLHCHGVVTVVTPRIRDCAQVLDKIQVHYCIYRMPVIN